MALISSLTITHDNASYLVRFTAQDHPGSLISRWSKNGTPVIPQCVPQFMRDSIEDLALRFHEANWYK